MNDESMGQLSPRETSMILGCHRVRVMQLIKEKKLPASRGKDGRVWLPRDAVEKFAATYIKSACGRKGPIDREGSMAAKVFLCLRQGKSLEEIVTDLQIAPKRARELYLEWKRELDDAPLAQAETHEEKRKRIALELEVKKVEVRDRQARIKERKMILDHQERTLKSLEKGKLL